MQIYRDLEERENLSPQLVLFLLCCSNLCASLSFRPVTGLSLHVISRPFLIRRITLVSPLKSLSNPSTQSPCLFTSLHRRRIRGERTIYRLLFSRDRRRKKDADGSLLLSRMGGRDTEVARTFVHGSVSSLVCVFPSHRLLVQIQFGFQTHQEREREMVFTSPSFSISIYFTVT